MQTNNFTLEIGTYKTAAELTKAITNKNYRISSWVQDMIDKMPIAKEKTTVELVVKSVKDLGFEMSATLDQIYAKAKEIGLELCPAEVGHQFLLQYGNQLALGEWITVGMEPIVVSDGDPFVFSVARYGDGSWLYGYYAGPVDHWRSDDCWVFCCKSDGLGVEPSAFDPLDLEARVKVLEDKFTKLGEIFHTKP